MQSALTKEEITIRVNGSKNFRVRAADGTTDNASLRGVALSNSPVLIEGGNRRERALVARALHNLGRGTDLPIRECKSAKELSPLIDATDVHNQDAPSQGTWLLQDVGKWPSSVQEHLDRFLSQLNVERIQGLHSVDSIPRVVALTAGCDTAPRNKSGAQQIAPNLRKQLSYFHISIEQDSDDEECS